MDQQTPATKDVYPVSGGTPALQDCYFDFAQFSALRHSLHQTRQALPVIMSRADFIHHVALHMPEAAALIEETDFGNLHLEMGALKLATRAAIMRYEFNVVRKHFSFVSYLFEYANEELYNAILVSYLEGLFISAASEAHSRARTLLPQHLEEALQQAEVRHQLFGRPHMMYGIPQTQHT